MKTKFHWIVGNGLPEHSAIIEAVPGVGNVGKIVVDALVEKHPSRTIGWILHPDFPPHATLSNEGLFHIQPKDYKNFVQAQEKLLKIKFEGKRVIQKKRKFFVASLLNEIQFKLNSIQRKFDSNWKLKLDKETKDKFSGKTKSFPAWLPINHVNLRLLGELSKIIKEKGSNLVVTDTFKYHSKSSSYIDNSSEFLYQSSKYYDFSYIPLHKDLNESAQRGISVSWKYDGHLNKIGNKIFADAMYHHIANNVFTNISTASKKN